MRLQDTFLCALLGWFVPVAGLVAQEGDVDKRREGAHDHSQHEYRAFRRDHNFSLRLAQDSSTWEGRIGEMEASVRARSKSYRTVFFYSFHIPLAKSVGYFLGTSVGGSSREINNSKLQNSYSVQLPGLDLGLVWEPSDSWRVSLGSSYSWQRVEGLKLEAGGQRASFSADTRALRIALDYFYLLSWAVSLQFEKSLMFYSEAGKMDFSKSSQSASLGLSYHLF